MDLSLHPTSLALYFGPVCVVGTVVVVPSSSVGVQVV